MGGAGRDAIDAGAIVDTSPMGRLQMRVVGLCALVAILDGFDNLAIAFAATPIARKLSIDVSAFGAVFAVSSFGLMIGSLIFGTVADRFGRKPTTIVAVLVIGIFSLLTPIVSSFGEVMAVRFLCGIGIGGVMPNIIALTAEYSPKSRRATLVTLMFSGVAVGAMLAGVLSAELAGSYGWQSVFYVGGLLALALAPLLAAALPESLEYLATGSSGRALDVLRRLDPHGSYDETTPYVVGRRSDARSGPFGLFSAGRGLPTALLWLVFFCNLLVWFFLTNWLPSILQRADFPMERAAFATVTLYAGGLLGGLSLSHMVDRRMSFPLLALTYGLGACSVTSIGPSTGGPEAMLLLVIFGTGFFVAGAQYTINAVAANFYPTELRSTGLGWALGIGRIGSILGPALGGALISLHWSLGQLLLIATIPMFVAACAALAIGRHLGRRREEVSPGTPIVRRHSAS